MAYYLTIKDKNNYKKLDISSMKEFTRTSKYKNDRYSLEELDLFTSCFNDEIELKRSLFKQNIIPLEDITNDISIRIKIKDKLEKVKYNLVYKDTYKYLDVIYLKSVLNILSGNKEFLNKLIAYYRNSFCNNENIAKIRWILLGNDGGELNINSVINDFIIKEVLKTDVTTGEVVIKYKSLHDLSMFTYNYLNKEENKKLDLLKLQKELLTENKGKTKKLTKEVEGQISLFD